MFASTMFLSNAFFNIFFHYEMKMATANFSKLHLGILWFSIMSGSSVIWPYGCPRNSYSADSPLANYPTVKWPSAKSPTAPSHCYQSYRLSKFSLHVQKMYNTALIFKIWFYFNVFQANLFPSMRKCIPMPIKLW